MNLIIFLKFWVSTPIQPIFFIFFSFRDIEKLIEQELQFYDEEHDGQNNQVDSSLYTDSYVDKRIDVVDNSSSSCGVNTQRVNENGSDDSQDYVLDNEEKKPENLHSEIDNYAVIQFN